jgi:hypothetical protein
LEYHQGLIEDKLMKLPSFKRLFVTDFDEEYQTLINKLVPVINDGFENVYNALSKRLTLGDNFSSTIRDVPVRVNASGTPLSQVFIKLDTQLPVLGITVINARNLTNSSTYPTSQPFISWVITNNGLQVLNVTGLQDSHDYVLRVVIWN